MYSTSASLQFVGLRRRSALRICQEGRSHPQETRCISPGPLGGLVPFAGQKERPMKALVAVASVSLMCGAAFAQNSGPAPQSGMEKPGMTNGAREDGSM